VTSLKRHAIPVIALSSDSDVALQLQRQLGSGGAS
jgi:hypothetical protein